MSWKILVIDDDPTSLTLIRAVLESEGFEVEVADSGALGIELIPQFQPHLLLLDQNMPEISGMQTLKKIRELSDYTSVIFISARSKVEEVVTGLDAGADDYIRKPFDPRELAARVRAQIRTKELRDELKMANEKLRDLVNIDDLTGLLNMRSVYDRLEQELDRGERYSRRTAVIMLDMDNFKQVNDQFDHLFGSFVLKRVGQLIQQSIRKVDFAARYGGDEFLMVLTETDIDGAMVFCRRLKDEIAGTEFRLADQVIHLTVSMGFSISEFSGKTSPKSLVKQADNALYSSKRAGRNCIHFFDSNVDQTSKVVDL